MPIEQSDNWEMTSNDWQRPHQYQGGHGEHTQNIANGLLFRRRSQNTSSPPPRMMAIATA